jgi:L-fuculose-phosphate aldolase
VSALLEPDRVVVTPSGVRYDAMTVADLVEVDPAGRVVAGRRAPTSELAMHLAMYRHGGDGAEHGGADTEPDGIGHGEAVRAVVHTHSPAATAVSTLVTELPSIHYALAGMGGPVRVAAYATFGTPQLAAAATAAMLGRSACLLANHGALTVGASLEDALERAEVLEWQCRVWLMAAAAGRPTVLTNQQIEDVTVRLGGYGQPF